MHKLIIPSLLALSLVASTALAEDKPSMNIGHMELHASSTDMHGKHGSTTPGMGHGTTTKAEHGSSTMALPPNLPGTVTSVGSTSFMMWSPATNPFFKDQRHATTSITVNVSSSTVFMHGSSTASLAGLKAGQHVVVFGSFSSATKALTATKVIIQGQPEKKAGKLEKFLDHLRKLFGKQGKGGDDMQASSTASSSSAAAVEGGGLGRILHALFGWL